MTSCYDMVMCSALTDKLVTLVTPQISATTHKHSSLTLVWGNNSSVESLDSFVYWFHLLINDLSSTWLLTIFLRTCHNLFAFSLPSGDDETMGPEPFDTTFFDTDTILILYRSNYIDTDTIPILQGSKNPDTDTIPILYENGMIPCMIPKKYGF